MRLIVGAVMFRDVRAAPASNLPVIWSTTGLDQGRSEQLPVPQARGTGGPKRLRPGFLAWGALQWHRSGRRGAHWPGFGDFCGRAACGRVTLLTSLAEGTAGGAPSSGTLRGCSSSGPTGGADRRRFSQSTSHDMESAGAADGRVHGPGAVLLTLSPTQRYVLVPTMSVRIASIVASVTGSVVDLRCLPEGDVDLHPRTRRRFPHPDTSCSTTATVVLCRRRRMLLGLAGAGVLLPLVPMVVGTDAARSRGCAVLRRDRCAQSFPQRLSDQLADADEALDQTLFRDGRCRDVSLLA